MKKCCKPDCDGRVHARSRCFEHWCKLVESEAREVTKARKKAAGKARPKKLFLEARAARLAGDADRHKFIVVKRALPEEAFSGKPRKGQKSFRGESIDRTFVSEAELNEGTGSWLGYEYFGDVSRLDWPERERYGLGGRDTSRMKK